MPGVLLRSSGRGWNLFVEKRFSPSPGRLDIKLVLRKMKERERKKKERRKGSKKERVDQK
jgi:hypothetical protein